MRARPWLILSIAFNVFAAAYLYVATEPFREPVVSVPSARYPGLLVRTNVVVRHENFTWEQIESTNYVTLINNLRAIGCPETTIRDIITSEVNRVYARRRVTEVVYANYQWWLSDPDPEAVRAARGKIARLEAERRESLTSLLGPGWEMESNAQIAARGGITLTGPILGDLPAAIKQAVYAVVAVTQKKIEAYEQARYQQGKSIDPMQMVRLREEPFAQLASVLTAEQYEEFALRYAPAAQQLREQMRGTELTPDQFRDLFSALNPIIGQPVYYYSGSDPQLLKQQQQLAAQAEAVTKQTLGAQFYAACQLNQDPQYRAAKATAQQLGVPDTTVMPMYEINRATQAELDRIRKDDTLSSDEKVQAMAQTQVEQQQSLEELLGPDAFQRWLEGQPARK